MFTEKDLKTLNKIQTKTPTISLYLNVDQKVLKPESIRTNFRNLLKKLKNVFEEEFLAKIRRRFRLRLAKNIRSLVFFANPFENIFYEYELPRPVKTCLCLEKNLHLAPLVKILDEYERYLVIVFDKSKAKIFSIYLGEIQKSKEIKQDFPGKHKMGGWSQTRYQRHIKDHLYRNLKKVKEEISRLSRKKEFGRLILAGPPEALFLMKKILPQNLRKKLAGEFRAELFATSSKILAKAREAEEKIERQKEKEKIKKWQKFLGKKNKSCSGMMNVIAAALQKRILELYLDLNLKISGYKCFSCHNLSLEKREACLICGAEIEKADLIDELVQEVLAQNGKVEFVVGDKELQNWGGIGARLRY
ncbi:MAG: Vms1/Ankzf1 family peptidyl-tRNA hydrolase [Patescibacteria group bacterium]